MVSHSGIHRWLPSSGYWILCFPDIGKLKAREEKCTLVHNSYSTYLTHLAHENVWPFLHIPFHLFQVAAELDAKKEMALHKKAQKEKKGKEEGKEKTKGKKTQKTGKKVSVPAVETVNLWKQSWSPAYSAMCGQRLLIYIRPVTTASGLGSEDRRTGWGQSLSAFQLSSWFWRTEF